MSEEQPKEIIMNGINLFDLLEVKSFKYEVEFEAGKLQQVWIEGYVIGDLVIQNEIKK